jgi:PAS domain S-box-containing protein
LLTNPENAKEEILSEEYCQLKEALILKEKIIEALSHPILIIDRFMNIRDANNAFLKMWGYDKKEDILGNHIKAFLNEPNEVESLTDQLQIQDSWTGEMIGRKRDGASMDVQASFNGIKDQKGAPTFFCGSIIDITENKHIKTRLQQAQKMEAIGALAGGIAHDFNNLLYPIIGYTELSMVNIHDPNKVQHYLNGIMEASNRAKDLVQQILTYSRHKDEEMRPVKLQSIIKEAVRLLRSSIPSFIEIRQDLDPICGHILASPIQIHQIIMNLYANAYHAMLEKGGLLEVTLREKEGDPQSLESNPGLPSGLYVELIVKDTGCGMDKTVIEKIFNPYFTTKGPEKGTGMGLAVVHGIVERYGGTIHVESEVGKGTTFHIYLPRITTSSEDPEMISPQPIQKGDEHILLVDDEWPILYMMQQVLQQLGYSVTKKDNGPGSLEAFQANPDDFDLVITDFAMPQMDVLELTSKLLEIRPNIPIILCTGFSESINREEARAKGICEYVLKPVITAELAGTIRKVLAKKGLGSLPHPANRLGQTVPPPKPCQE